MPKKKVDNIFQEYLESRITIEQAFARSSSWYASKIKELSHITPEMVMKHKNMFTNSPKRGEIYSFVYDPKHKDTLPYYDTFPLVLPITQLNDGFLGLNFHYIRPKDRIYLLDAIRRHGKGKDKMMITWEIMAKWSGSKSAAPCLKRYLFSQMRSPLRRIQSKDIPTALLVPIERFVKANKQQVWRNS